MSHFSRTTLRELKKRYLNVLKKCFLLNIIAFSCVSFSFPVLAESEGLVTVIKTEKAIISSDTIIDLENKNLTYENSSSTSSGGVFYVNSEKKLEFKNSGDATTIVGFESNSSSYEGGAIYNSNNGIITFNTDTTFMENSVTGSANVSGGSIHNLGTIKFVKDVIFKENSVTSNGAVSRDYAYGGAIYNENEIIFDGYANFTANKVTIMNAAAYGGAIYNVVSNSTGRSVLTFNSNADFINNLAETSGGAVYNNYNGEIKFNKDTLFKGNQSNYGGAIVNNGVITFDNKAIFIDNSATGLGGAIYNEGIDSSIDVKITFNDGFLFGGNVISDSNSSTAYGADIYNSFLGKIIFAQGQDKVGSLEGGIYQGYASEINKTGKGTLILGDNMMNIGYGASVFSQSAGLTIAHTNKLNFAATNNITGGELRVHGDSLENLNIDISNEAMLTYLTTTANEQTLSLPNSISIDPSSSVTLTFGAYTSEAKEKEVALAKQNKVPSIDSTGDRVYDSNGNIVLQEYDARNNLLTSTPILKATYLLNNDIVDSTGNSKVIFKDSNILLGSSDYQGSYEIDSTNTIDLRDSLVQEKTISFSRLSGSDAKLGLDVQFISGDQGIEMKTDKLTLNSSTYQFSGIEVNFLGKDLLNTLLDDLLLDQVGSMTPRVQYSAEVLGGNAVFKNTQITQLTTSSPYAYELKTSGQTLSVSANKLAEGVTALKYINDYAGNTTLQMVDDGSGATYNMDATEVSGSLSVGNKIILGASGEAEDSTINANGHKMFMVDKAETSLSMSNLTISGAEEVINNQTGEVTLNNVIIKDTVGDRTIVNASSLNLKDVVIDKDIDNSGVIVGEGIVTLAGLTGNGTLKMNEATLEGVDGFVTTNKVVSNNMQIGDSIQEITFNELEIKSGTTFDIDNKHVTASKVTFGEGSTLSVTLNNLADYGSLTHDDLVGDETANLNLKLTNGIDTQTGIYQVFNKDNKLTLLENNLLNIVDRGDGSYQIRKKADEILESDLGLNKNEVGIIDALLKENENEDKNEIFNKVQEEVLDALQSENEKTFSQGRKALKALAGSNTLIYQAQVTANFIQMHTVIGQMLMNTTSGIFGHSGGEERSRASVYVKGLYDRVNSLSNNGFKLRTKGSVLGIQSQLTENLTVGVGYAFTNTIAKEDVRRSDIDTNSGFVSAQYQSSDWWVNGVVTYSRSQYDEEKYIMSYRSKANYDVDSLGTQITSGYNIKLDNLIIAPEAGIRYLNIRQEGYKDSIGTMVEHSNSDFVTVMAGLKVGADLGKVRPLVGVIVGYDVVSDDIVTTNTLANGGLYTIRGEALDRLSTMVVGGLGADLGKNSTIKLEYSGNYRKEYFDHSGMIRFELKF